MDRQEYREIIGEIKSGYKNRDYERVIMFAKEIPLRKIKENSVIEMIATAYDKVGKPALARTTLEMAYKRMPGGKQTAYRLSQLALKTQDIEAAVGYYEDFCRIAPNDNQRYILKYEIAQEGGLSIYDKIRILEEYTSKETDDKWMYELARLYHEAGMGDQCAAMCDDIVVWFSDGDYLKKALELKFAHKALTPTQQAMYEKIMQDYIEDYEEPEPVVEEPSPLEEVAAEEFANDFLENNQSQFGNTKPVEIPEEAISEVDADETENHMMEFSSDGDKAAEPEQGKNIFYDFRLEDAALEPNPELNKWLASLPDIKEINKKTEEIYANDEEYETEDIEADSDEKVFADIPVPETEEEEVTEAVVEGSDAVLENLEQEDEKRMVEANKIFNEPIASEGSHRKDFEEELNKLYSSALESIKETPGLDEEFDKKKVEYSEGQLGINLDLLNSEESEVEGQLSIDQLFQTYANNIENNMENKAAVAKVEAERLKQIREAVEQSRPETPILDIEDEEPEVEEQDEPEQDANKDPDMDEEDRWDEDPVEKILKDFVAKQPAKEEPEVVAEPEVRVEENPPQKDIEIPEFLKNLQFDEVEEEITEEEALFYEGESLEAAEDIEPEKTVYTEPERHVKTEEEIEEELDDMSGFLDDFMKDEEEALSEVASEEAEQGPEEVSDEEAVQESDAELQEEAEETAIEENIIAKAGMAGAGAAIVGEAVAEDFSDDELEELGNTLADIFGDDEIFKEEAVEEKAAEETSNEESAADDVVVEEEEKAEVSEETVEAEVIEEAVAEEAEEPAEEIEETVTEAAGEEVEEAVAEEAEEPAEEIEETVTEAAGEEPAEETVAEEVEETAEETVSEDVVDEAEEAVSEEAEEKVEEVEDIQDTEDVAVETVPELSDEEDELFNEIFNEISDEHVETDAEISAEETAEASDVLDRTVTVGAATEAAENAEEVAEEEIIEEEAETGSEIAAGAVAGVVVAAELEEAAAAEEIAEEAEEISEEMIGAHAAEEDADPEESEEITDAEETVTEEITDESVFEETDEEAAADEETAAEEVADEEAETEAEVADEMTEETDGSEAATEGETEGEEELSLEDIIDEAAEEADSEAQEAEETEVSEEQGVSGDTQEIEKIHRFSLDEESREEIAEFLLIQGMGEKITRTVEDIILTNKSGDATGGNLIVTGDAKTGKTFLSISMIKAVNKELNSGSGKVAKVQAESLNGKDIEKVFLKIAGNDLIIENVGDLDDKTISDIIEVMQNGGSQNMVVIEGNMLAVETMINKHPEIEKLFKNRVDISELSITQWADVACDYAKRKGYKVGDMALLALHAKIDEINLPTSRFGYEDIVNIMEAAIEKCEKRNTGKLFSAFSRKEDDAIELSESDFV